jgi:hypothetical protein
LHHAAGAAAGVRAAERVALGGEHSQRLPDVAPMCGPSVQAGDGTSASTATACSCSAAVQPERADIVGVAALRGSWGGVTATVYVQAKCRMKSAVPGG